MLDVPATMEISRLTVNQSKTRVLLDFGHSGVPVVCQTLEKLR